MRASPSFKRCACEPSQRGNLARRLRKHAPNRPSPDRTTLLVHPQRDSAANGDQKAGI